MTLQYPFRRSISVFAALLLLSPAAIAAAAPAQDATAAKVVGDWSGNLDAGGQLIPLVFHVVLDEEGALAATMDSPAQGATGIALDVVSFDGSKLRMELHAAAAFFEGTISEDSTKVEGHWNQGGAVLPLTVEKQ